MKDVVAYITKGGKNMDAERIVGRYSQRVLLRLKEEANVLRVLVSTLTELEENRLLEDLVTNIEDAKSIYHDLNRLGSTSFPFLPFPFLNNPGNVGFLIYYSYLRYPGIMDREERLKYVLGLSYALFFKKLNSPVELGEPYAATHAYEKDPHIPPGLKTDLIMATCDAHNFEYDAATRTWLVSNPQEGTWICNQAKPVGLKWVEMGFKLSQQKTIPKVR